MMCYYCEGNEMVAPCSQCGKNLCKSCYDLNEGHLCVARPYAGKYDVELVSIRFQKGFWETWGATLSGYGDFNSSKSCTLSNCNGS